MNSNVVYEKQFILTTGKMSFPESFCEEQIGALRVLSGRDLHVTKFSKGNQEVLLLGDWYDYNNPEFSNLEIIEKYLNSSSVDDFIVNTYPTAGVYVVVWRNGDDIKIFNDLHALKSVFYNYNGDSINIVSDPQLGKVFFNLTPCVNPSYREAVTTGRGKREGCCPGMNTGWRHLFRLSTNHYLDVKKRVEIRFFPNKKLQPLELAEAVPVVSQMLKDYIRACRNRNDVILGVTAGWDSRILLSSVDSNSDLNCYTLRYSHGEDETTISKELCGIMNLPHRTINCQRDLLDEDFVDSVEKNIDSPMENDLRILEAIRKSGMSGKVDISGITGEELRGRHRRGMRVNTVKAISGILGFPNSAYVNKEVEKWLDNNLKLCKEIGIYYIDKLYSDLYYCVSKAKSIRTFDHVVDTVVPYNSRELFIICNSVPAKNRTPFNPRLMREVVNYNKPELLEIPINPGKNLSQQLLSKTGMYYPAVTIYDAVRKDK